MLRTLLIILLFVKVTLTWSQTTGEKGALKDLSRQRWSKCKEKLTKVFSKDSVSTGGHYILALYLFQDSNPDFNLDSAYVSVSKAIFFYQSLPLRERERLTRLPVDSSTLKVLRQKIDSAAFQRARKLDTEEGYHYFLRHFPTSANYGDAILLLHDAAYRVALNANTFEAFEVYLRKYPESIHSDEARHHYDRLLFAERTKDKKLTTYRTYLVENPRSPYRLLVEEQILELSSASGEPDSLVRFIRQYPNGPAAVKARNILYHLLPEKGNKSFPQSLMTDSLASIEHLNNTFLVPFLSSNRFGFMNSSGDEIIEASAEEIDQQYLCGNITEDVLAIQNKLMGRNGKVIYEGNIEEIDDAGFGFLMVSTSDDKLIIHKSGFTFLSDSRIEDIFIPDGRIVAVKIDESWLLYTLAGKRLSDSVWQDVKNINHVLALKKDNRWHLLTYQQVGLLADQQPLLVSEGFDDVKAWPHNFIWVKRGDLEGILDDELNMRIPLEERPMKYFTGGFESRSSTDVRLYDHSFNESGVFQDVKVGLKSLAVRLDDQWKLYDPSGKNMLTATYDSISFSGRFPVGYRRDSIHICFDDKKLLAFKRAVVNYVSGSDSSAYLLVVQGNRRSLYNHEGKKLFEVNYDNLQIADKGIFIVSKKEKKGLLADNGKVLLPITYDAIGDGDGKNIPLLRSMRFGLYNIMTKKEIAPQYDKNLKLYNDNLIIAFKNGHYGMIDFRNRTVLPFGYDEIVHWHDSAAFVRKDVMWQLLDLKENTVILDQIKSFSLVTDSEKEKVVIVQQGNTYGVISTTRGIVLPFTFSDIINIGSGGNPLYFTEKHVEEANIFVVIYYDQNGKLIRRQVFEPEEYEMIYCSDN